MDGRGEGRVDDVLEADEVLHEAFECPENVQCGDVQNVEQDVLGEKNITGFLYGRSICIYPEMKAAEVTFPALNLYLYSLYFRVLKRK